MEKSALFPKHTLIYLLYIGLTFIFIYPTYLYYSNAVYSFGDPQDMIWHLMWAYNHILKDFGQLFHGNIFYPANYSFIFTDHMIGTLIVWAPVYFITKNPIFSYNFLIFFLTVLAGISMYSLVYYLTKKSLASFFSGFIFAFSPVLLYMGPNLPVVATPLMVLFLHKFLKEEKTRHVILFAFIFSFIALSSMYFSFGIAFITLIYTIGYYIKIKRLYERTFFIKALLGILIIMIFVLPFRLPYLKLKEEYGYKRKLGEMVQHSADPIASYISSRGRLYNFKYPDFVIESTLPGEEWLFTKVVSLLGNKFSTGIEKLPGETITKKLPYSMFQNILKSGRKMAFFFGFLPLFLSILGIYYMGKYDNGSLKNIRSLFLYILFTFYILSLGPVLVIFGHITYIPLPGFLFYYIIPGFSSMRRVADFGTIVFMILAFFTGFGILKLEEWLEKRKNKPLKVKILLFSLVFLISTAEIIKAPLDEKIDHVKVGNTIPDVYKWLSKAKIEGAVAELPTVKGYYDKYDPVYGEHRAIYFIREINYMYYSVYHKKPIINGWGALIPDSFFKIRDQLYSIPDSSAVKYLISLNINTFILHTSDFDPEDIEVWTDENIKKAGLKEFARFGDDIVLKFSN